MSDLDVDFNFCVRMTSNLQPLIVNYFYSGNILVTNTCVSNVISSTFNKINNVM